MTYKTSLDNLAKGITIVITILFIGISIVPVFVTKEDDEAGPIALIFTSLLLLLIYLLTFAYRPINYVVTSTQLVIHRLLKDVVIDRANIVSVELIDKKKLSGSLRVFGVGGLFGYFGKFSNNQIGNMTWYATRRDHVVLIVTTDNQKIILTPNEPNSFLAEVKIP